MPLHRIQIDYLASNEDSYTHTHPDRTPNSQTPRCTSDPEANLCGHACPQLTPAKETSQTVSDVLLREAFFPLRAAAVPPIPAFYFGEVQEGADTCRCPVYLGPPPCGRLALTQTPLLSQSARAQVLQEARSSYSSGSGGSHSSNRDGVKEDVFSLTVCVYYSMCRVGMRSTVRCDLNT